eukprot:gene13261-4094_t
MATQSVTSDSVENTEENTTGELQIDWQLTRIRAYRRGNRSVVTKLQGEVTQIIRTRSNSYTEPDVLSRLQSISDLLKAKQDYLRRVSDEILGLCSIEEIDKEIEDCSEWETRILETLEKIVHFKQGRYTSISTHVGNDEEAEAVPAFSTPGMLEYQIMNPDISLSYMFGILEDNAADLGIIDYSLSQTTLEQVFINFAKYQREEAAKKKKLCACCCT